MEFKDAWLEVRACAGGVQAVDADVSMLEVPAIMEVLEAAVSADRHPGMWDYSRRLKPAEIERIQAALKLVKTFEDGRSVLRSAVVAYKGSSYTLTVFAVKGSQ